MSSLAIGLLFVSALIHVGWNLIGKREHSSPAFLLVANTLGFLCLLPAVIVYWEAIGAFPRAVWGWLILTGLFQALYYAALASAYRTGELSLVYPLARSGAVVFVVFLNELLGRGGQLSGLALAGMTLIVLGAFLLPLQKLRDVQPAHYFAPATLLALLAAMGTAGYSIVDDWALRTLRGAPGLTAGPLASTLVYSFFEGVTSSIWLGVLVVGSRPGRVDLGKAWTQQLKQAGLAGIGIYAGYTLVLLSMAFVSNVGYAVAFRQVSVPLGALVGILGLGDRSYLPKLLGVAGMFAGLVMVGLG
jgi:drug/metabolite transporter (DMT)-like permease